MAFATEKFEDIIPACTEELNLSEAESQHKLEALSLRASFYFLTGQFNDAIEDLNSIIASKDAPDDLVVNALVKRASIYMQTERLTECLEDFDAAAAKGPNVSGNYLLNNLELYFNVNLLVDVFHHRGQVKLLLERTEEAREDFEKAVRLNPNFSIAYVQKCYSDYRHAMQTQNVDLLIDSMSSFERAIEKFPGCPETYVLFAQVKTEKQQYEEAEELYKRALQIDPSNASVYVHKGLLLLQWKGDTERAVELMKEGIKIDDRCEFAFETLGTVEVQR